MRLALAMLTALLGGATAMAQTAPTQTAPQAAVSPAPPQVAVPVLPPVGAAATLAAVLPMQAAGFNRVGLTDFEARPGGQGLGAAAEYRPAEGSGVATAYHYSRGFAGLPEGPDSPAVTAELQAAVADIRSVAPLRRYGLANLAEAPPVLAPDGRPALHCLGMLLAYEGGVRAADSFVCVGVLHGRFLKLRLTLPTERQGETQPRLTAFGRAVVAALAAAG